MNDKQKLKEKLCEMVDQFDGDLEKTFLLVGQVENTKIDGEEAVRVKIDSHCEFSSLSAFVIKAFMDNNVEVAYHFMEFEKRAKRRIDEEQYKFNNDND